MFGLGDFKNVHGQFIPNRPAKYLITSTNMIGDGLALTCFFLCERNVWYKIFMYYLGIAFVLETSEDRFLL